MFHANILKIIWLVGILAIQSTNVLAGSQCPKREELYPCSCHEIPDKGKRFTLVVCNGLESMQQLNDVSKNLKQMAIDRMVVMNLNHSKDASLQWELNSVQIREITVQDSLRQICIWQMKTWPGFYSSLTSLTVNNGSLTSTGLCLGELAKFSNLQHLDVSHNEITSITPFPSTLSHIKKLDLSFNNLTSIQAGTFSALALSQLNLSYNKLTTLNRNMFAVVNDTLTELDLSGNPITHLPDDFLLKMYTLNKLNLQNTMIQVIHLAVINVSRSISYIDLTDNFIVCNCTMSWASSGIKAPSPKRIEVKGHCKNPKTFEFKDIKSPTNYNECAVEEGVKTEVNLTKRM